MVKENPNTFSKEEREAMRARAKELKEQEKLKKNRKKSEEKVFEEINKMTEPDKVMAKKLHKLITKNFPNLFPKTMYGMPAYAKEGKVLCFFQAASKFNTRYSTFNFEHIANLENGNMWPVSFGIKKLTTEVENKILELIKNAL